MLVWYKRSFNSKVFYILSPRLQNIQGIMKIILLVASLVALSSAGLPVNEEWHMFKRQHGKSYKNPSEEHYRLAIFMDNLKTIQEHNSKYAEGLVSYYMKLNRFGDLTPEEVTALVNGFNKSGQPNNNRVTRLTYLPPANVELPASVDWRQKGAVTPVKDQGSCGSCWAFSTTGSLEGQLFRKTGRLVSLSEQQLIDCSEDYGNSGCDGGLMDDAFSYIEDAGGLGSESSYPYTGQQGNCRRPSSVSGTSVRSYIDISPGNVNALKSAVATVGPVSIAVSAGNNGFMHYGGGVFSGDTCEPSALDHGVLLVGYGSENGQDYWIVKNSWNSGWGENGYVRIARNSQNICGIASMASYPVL